MTVAPFADARRGAERTHPGRATRWGWSPTHGPSVGLAAAVAVCAIGAAAAANPDAVDHGPVLCPFRLTTGLPCPGCGLTRAWVLLLHGQPGAAAAANPFGIVALLAAVALVAVATSSLVRGRPVPTYADLQRSLSPARGGSWMRYAGVLVLACWVAFGVARMVLAMV